MSNALKKKTMHFNNISKSKYLFFQNFYSSPSIDFIQLNNWFTFVFLKMRFFFFCDRLFGCSGSIFVKLPQVYVYSSMKNGLFEKFFSTLMTINYYIFFFLKKNSLEKSVFNHLYSHSEFIYFFLIRSYFLSNFSSFLSTQCLLWWIVDFLDINFWVKCSVSNLKKNAKNKIESKYETEIKYYSNFSKKVKKTLNLVFLESVLNSSNTLKKRQLFTFLDVLFNYKSSVLYKKKLLVYKKLFN